MSKLIAFYTIPLFFLLIGCGAPPQEKAIAELEKMTEIFQKIQSEDDYKSNKEDLMESAKRFKEFCEEWKEEKKEMSEKEIEEIADEYDDKIDNAFDIMREAMRDVDEYGVKRSDFDLR